MCGITGIAYFSGQGTPSAELIRTMCDTIVHRGPDEEGIHVADGVGLGMRRLSIIDLAGGQQPVFNENSTVRTVFNGEIYNFQELRRELEGRGHQFRTRCDTEVIVHAYEEFGNGFADRLNGMFAIALHDMANRRLILARDHLGIKPLFYYFGKNFLTFGSEIKTMLASGLVPRDLEIDALGEFMSWEYVPASRTLFQKVMKLEPAEMLTIDLSTGRSALDSFWDVPVATAASSKTAADWEDEVDAKITECVQRQLISDVPLGAFLSGGVDSSLIAAAMETPQTFSIGFKESSYNELPYAQAVADHLGTDHYFEIIQPEAVELFDTLMYLLDDPIGDFSIFPTYLVSRVARKHVTVALSGDGGDELFGGYETYVANHMAERYSRIPAWFRRQVMEPAISALRPREAKKGMVNKAKRFLEGMEHDSSLAHARWRLFVGQAMRKNLFTNEAISAMPTPVEAHIDRLYSRARSRDLLNQNLYVDTRSYLSDNILTKVDRMSMGVSLETRVPFLDKELVALSFQIPGTLKVKGASTKVLLKRVAARHVPPQCVYRPKEGFSIPIKAWLGERFRPLMEELLGRDRLQREGLFNHRTVDRLKHEHLSGLENHSHILWSMMIFQAWQDRWLSGSIGNSQAGARHVC